MWKDDQRSIDNFREPNTHVIIVSEEEGRGQKKKSKN